MSEPLVTALAGITIACRDPDILVSMFTDVLGWDVVSDTPLDPAVSASWGVATAPEDRCIILAATGANRGMIRVVPGPDRIATARLRARWAGVEILVARDLDALYEKLVALPAFRSIHVPTDSDWSEYGSNIHRAFIGIGPGGTHLAFTMAVTKPLGRDFPATEAGVGYVFDVPLLTDDYARATQFYRGTLGMIAFLESRFTEKPWHDLWGIAKGSPVNLDILKGDAGGTGLGGIELQGYEPGVVDQAPARRDRLDGGTSIVTYTTGDIDRAYAAISSNPTATVLGEPTAFETAPYHGGRAFCAMGPGGERLEVCERLWR